MSGHHSRRVRAVLFAFALGIAAVAGSASPAVAQDDGVAFDENETEGTIDRVRFQLLGIAAVTGALLVGYIWHTDPQRRQRVALRRRDDRERAALDALDDEFILPADVDDDAPDAPTEQADAGEGGEPQLGSDAAGGAGPESDEPSAGA